jgi:uncharacterized repeat protein (TIGR03803 family)
MHFHSSLPGTTLRAATAALAIVFVLTSVFTKPAQAQTYEVIYNFILNGTGYQPYAGLTMDAAGSLYGTTSGGDNGPGTVFDLTPRGSVWVFSLLHRFGAAGDGALPWAGVAFGPDGTLYGTTVAGGASGNGTVFDLSPPTTICRAVACPWTETVLYSFGGGDDADPGLGNLIFDATGKIYGTTTGGTGGGGVAYQLAPSGDDWTENVLHTFGSPGDGAQPAGGVILDDAGNLYGTTVYGGASGAGTVFKLTYSAGLGWTETILYSFQGGNDGSDPYAGLIFDSSGNLYGTTTGGGQGGGGVVFELTPSGSGWNYILLHSFTGSYGPLGPLIMDSAGSLYGTTYRDGADGAGNIFKLTPSSGGWTYTSLHDFSTDRHDGANPIGNVILDSQGNLFGTTSSGGTGCRYNSCGVVWEITP